MKAIAGKYKGLLGGKSGSAIMGNQGPLGACGGGRGQGWRQGCWQGCFCICIIVSGNFSILLRRGVKSACEATLLFFVFDCFKTNTLDC